MLNTQFNKRVLIDFFIWNDDQNSSRHIIYVRAHPTSATPAPGPRQGGSHGPGGTSLGGPTGHTEAHV